MTVPLLVANKLERIFDLGSEQIRAVHDVDLEIYPGKFFVITGRSGSGKTTLLNILGGLDSPTSGSVHFQDQDLSKLTRQELTQLRRGRIGFIFQSFGLLSLLSAYENVELPLRIDKWSRSERQKRALECLDMVGLGNRGHHRPYELSGGELQRIAIARAIAHRPALILADEPTGELDMANGAEIISLLKDIASRDGVGVVVATHDLAVTEVADVTRELSDGTFTNG